MRARKWAVEPETIAEQTVHWFLTGNHVSGYISMVTSCGGICRFDERGIQHFEDDYTHPDCCSNRIKFIELGEH